jgi:hypothetical protein
MNRYDVEFNRVNSKMARGGKVTPSFEISTPTGVKSKLTYVEQLLVRTTAFKNWFGDWERAAQIFQLGSINVVRTLKEALEEEYVKNYPDIGKLAFQNLYNVNDLLPHFREYDNVSKTIDADTLEPMVVFHGTRQQEKFYEFKTAITGETRPYAYFAINQEYSDNFKEGGFLYRCFISVKNPFVVNNFSSKLITGWVGNLIESIFPMNVVDENYRSSTEWSNFLMNLNHEETRERPFWTIMARDYDGYFKKLLISLGFDGISYGEEFSNESFTWEKSQYTRAYTIFNPNQVKLANGLNTQFNPFSNDIRFEDGGALENEIMLPDTSSKFSHLKRVLNLQGYSIEKINSETKNSIQSEEKFAVGGTIKHEKGKTNDGKKGGYFEGRSHADGGIKAWNTSTNSPIEVEGGEVIITKKAVDDDELKEFEGEMLTNRQILSKINQSGGGVAFEDGGEIHQCNCSGKMFKFGGETMEDYMIVKRLDSSYQTKNQRKQKMAKYGHSLMRKMKQGGFI